MTYIDDHIERLDLAAALAAVSGQRRAHALRYRNELDQRLSLAAYRLLQHALQTEYGLYSPPEFEHAPGGKPVIVGHPHIHFSLSHCRDAAACVVSDKPVGIDVESMSEYTPELPAAVMNEEEQQHISLSAEPAVVFMRLWTMKESLLKLTGEGIAKDMRQVLSRPGNGNRRYHFETTIHPRYVCTVCRGVEPNQ